MAHPDRPHSRRRGAHGQPLANHRSRDRSVWLRSQAGLHAIGVLLLITATLAIWHWRFAVVPGAIPEAHLAKPLIGWKSAPHQQHRVELDQAQPVLQLGRESPDEKNPSVGIWLGQLKDVRFIHVRSEARWEGVERGANDWNHARFTVAMKDPDGKVSHPPDSLIFSGTGSSDWMKSEAVVELTGDMEDTNFAVAMLGERGLLEVRQLHLTAVKQRYWVPLAATLTVAGWITLCASLMHRRRPRLPWWRAALAGTLIVGLSWVTVFPQTKGLLRPVFSSFDVGPLPSAPAPPAIKTPAPQPKVTLPPPAKPAPPKSALAGPPSEPADKAAVPKKPIDPRDSGKVHRLARGLDKKFQMAHLALFTAFSLAIFVITGSSHQWPLPVAVAILSELIPELTDKISSWDDFNDLIQNLAGVGVAILIWKLAARGLARRKPAPSAAP